jgi:hypothetical protein
VKLNELEVNSYCFEKHFLRKHFARLKQKSPHPFEFRFVCNHNLDEAVALQPSFPRTANWPLIVQTKAADVASQQSQVPSE